MTIESDGSISPSSTVPPDHTKKDKYTISDILIAGCICVAALSYWAWDQAPVRSAQPQPAIADSQIALSDRLNNDGTRLYSASNYAGAEVLFRDAIAANPAGALGYCNLGAALIAERRFDEAIAALQKALTLDPQLALARNNLSWAQMEKGKARQ